MWIPFRKNKKVTTKHHICDYHKKDPKSRHPGCTCSSVWSESYDDDDYNEILELELLQDPICAKHHF